MRIMLAPMEGVVDHHLRNFLTGLGGLDGCVTEFVRVTDQVLPYKVFLRLAPEILQDCLTDHGVPVKVQLLGGKPEPMGINAAEAVRAGARAIDINFGCPAKTVNRNDGGACLLRQPERVYAIVKAVRNALPANIPVSAKIRLGYEDRNSYIENALAVAEAGASELTVHARSKADGYKPPAYWEHIGEIRRHVTLPVVANGEIWNLSDYLRCRDQSGCEDVMLGRGLLACPDLARQIKAAIAGEAYAPLAWHQVCEMLHRYYHATLPQYVEKNCGNRIKQWLMYLRLHYPQATIFFEEIKRKRTPVEIEAALSAAMTNAVEARAI